MDLEKLLRESKPELPANISQLNTSVLAALQDHKATPGVQPKPAKLVDRFFQAFVQYPLPVLTASSLLISVVLLQLGNTFGFSHWLIQQAGSIVFR